MVCRTSCVVATIFIVAMIFTMYGTDKTESITNFSRILTHQQNVIYDKIENEQLEVYSRILEVSRDMELTNAKLQLNDEYVRKAKMGDGRYLESAFHPDYDNLQDAKRHLSSELFKVEKRKYAENGRLIVRTIHPGKIEIFDMKTIFSHYLEKYSKK